MDTFEIEQYMKSKEKFTIPEIQNQFHLTYGEVRRYFHRLEKSKQIILTEELQYSYNFDVEKTLDLFRKLLWECILNEDYNKYALKRKFNLKNTDIASFEKWLEQNNYYDFDSDELLISKDEFINRYGKMDNQKSNINKTELEQAKMDVLKRIQQLSNEQKDDVDLKSEDELNISNDDLIYRSILKQKKHIDRKWPKSMFINLFNCFANRQGVMTKEDFLSTVELEIQSRGKDSAFSVEVLEQIINEIKDFTEDEYLELKSILSALI